MVIVLKENALVEGENGKKMSEETGRQSCATRSSDGGATSFAIRQLVTKTTPDLSINPQDKSQPKRIVILTEPSPILRLSAFLVVFLQRLLS